MSCSNSTGVPSMGVQQPQPEADHSSAPDNQVKNEWSYTSTPLYAFMVRKDTDMSLHFGSIQNKYFQNHRMVTCGNVEASTVPWTTDPPITQHSSMKRSSIMGTFGTYC